MKDNIKRFYESRILRNVLDFSKLEDVLETSDFIKKLKHCVYKANTSKADSLGDKLFRVYLKINMARRKNGVKIPKDLRKEAEKLMDQVPE